MAKSPRSSGENRGRRAADRRHAAEQPAQATEPSQAMAETSGATETAARGSAGPVTSKQATTLTATTTGGAKPPARQGAVVGSTSAAGGRTAGRQVSKEQIARRAYELYVARGGTHGYDIEDWLQAERELRGK